MSSETTQKFSDSAQKNAIQMQRSEILDDIYSVYGTSSINHEGSNALNQEYNELSDPMEAPHGRSIMDPLLFLPAELWTDIVREATKGIGTAGPSTDALLLLTLVSSDWRTKLMSTPRLWTYITIGNGEADAQAKLETTLWLSQTLHFTLQLNIYPLQWGETLSLLQLHAHRIKEIAFGFSQGQEVDTPKYAEFLRDFFPSLGHLLALQVIRGNIARPVKLDWHDIATRAPNLRYIYDLYASAVPLEILRTLTLRACTIEAQSSEVLQNLGDMSHVEELSWNLNEDPKAYSGICSLPSMPVLKQVRSDGVPTNNVLLLLKRAGNLITLKISIIEGRKDLYDLFNLFEHLPHLQVLDLDLDPISVELTLPAKMNLCQTRVRDLSITYYTPYAAGLPGLDALFNLFPIYFPTLRSLNLASIAWNLPLASYIKSLSTLWYLRLVYVSRNFDVSIDSSSLQHLVLVGFTEDFLSLIRNSKCSTLSKLIFIDYEFKLEGEVVQPPQEAYYPHENDTSPMYATIETLEIASNQAIWEVSKFTALRKLQVGEFNMGSSGLLVDLMLQPCSCPALTDIELLFIPEWDLLFLMLERRNFPSPQHSHSPGIAKIQTIRLPSPVPPFLLGPLTVLLSGERPAISTRPSNWDLSFCGFMEEYFDPKIPGCEMCLISMMACTAPSFKVPERNRIGHRPKFHEIYLPPEQSGVPADVWEWLRSRENRRSAWKAQEDTWRFGRYEMCAEMKLAQRPFGVTRYSMSGKWFHT